MPQRFRTILFDVYGTLLDVHGVAARADVLFPGHGNALSIVWREAQLRYTWLRTLAGRHADFWQVTGDALDYAAEALGLELSAATRQDLMGLYLRLPAWPEVAQTLQTLRDRNIKLAALSNGTPQMLEAALGTVGLLPLLGAVLSIEATGRYKVAPEAYRIAVDRFGGSPADFLLVSSNGWDVAGAGHFGFATFWVNRTGSPVERLGIAPSGIGTSLADLAAWLG